MDDISRPRPVLVYDRIHINRRNTVLLLPLFVALLLPLAYCLTQLVVPFFALNILMTRVDALQVVASTETRALTMMLLALVFGCSTALLGYFLSTDIVLWVADGRRVDRREEPLLSRTVENLCLGGGLPQPAVYVVESRTPNAF